MEKQELTICSVYHSLEAKRLLELNYDWVKKMNPGKELRWVVADNTPKNFTGKIDSQRFIVVPGADHKESVPPWLVGSYHHSQAIAKSLPAITTRFALFLDSDFYIVRHQWIDEILRYMEKNNLAFFGVPWHPAYAIKYRYFPAPHTMFVDTQKIPTQTLDFQPLYDDILHPTAYTGMLRRLRKIKEYISARAKIGTSRDTATRIYQKYYHSPDITWECPQPVFDPADDLRDIKGARGASSMIECFLPDRFCYNPKRQNYYTKKGFRENGYADARATGMEEFMWQGRPYGFHVRGSHKLTNDLEQGIRMIAALLEDCKDAPVRVTK
ncbi:MAG: hypothetical protein U1A25_03210 [Candidatus Sungbacteria bacterium]|nr:hypothetical protein [bacterium]MDZ4260652.1 hypothetical protein [Candidatus Sungbacteria bacterium]